jgi:hypothetical protein
VSGELGDVDFEEHVLRSQHDLDLTDEDRKDQRGEEVVIELTDPSSNQRSGCRSGSLSSMNTNGVGAFFRGAISSVQLRVVDDDPEALLHERGAKIQKK